MAADVATFNPAGIPGLGQPLENAHLNLSRFTYNKLPNIEDQAELQIKYAQNITAMLAIIESHSMGACFRVHSAHRHGTIPDGTVRLEADMGTNGMKWNRATAIENPAANQMHPNILKLVEKKWVAVEFAKGPLPFAGMDVPAEFLAESAAFLTDNGLTDLMVLEIGDFAKDGAMGSGKTAELEIHWGSTEVLTVVVPVCLLADKSLVQLIPTGWNVKVNSIGLGPAAQDPDGEPDPGTHWAKVTTPKDTHKVFVDSVESLTAQLLTETLVRMGLIMV